MEAFTKLTTALLSLMSKHCRPPVSAQCYYNVKTLSPMTPQCQHLPLCPSALAKCLIQKVTLMKQLG